MDKDLLEKYQYHQKYSRLSFYDPYPFQREFHHGLGHQSEMVASQVGLICANQVGKTTAGAAEATYHALGEYPDWWRGVRFQIPVTVLCAGVSNDSTKRIIQKELVGGTKDSQLWGTGMIPKSRLLEPTRKAGVPDAYEKVLVKGKWGTSEIWMMAYEQGWKKFQGIRFHFGWPDEEPPEDIWAQMLRGTISQGNSRLAMTMTPEEGMTGVVINFMNNIQKGQHLVTATWEDAKHNDSTKKHEIGETHLTEEKKEQILGALPEYQREMRSKGIPLMGSGLVWPIKEEDISYDPKDLIIQDHWPRGCGQDFGKSDHPTANVWFSWDRDLDILYLYDCLRVRKTISENAVEIHRKTEPYIPIFWPHDANQLDPRSSRSYAELYRLEGLNMWWESFTNPPKVGDKKGDIGVESGIDWIWERMKDGRFKVNKNLRDWFEEFRMYHRMDGKVVPIRDDLMSATRYGALSQRNFRTPRQSFGEPLKYSNKGIV